MLSDIGATHGLWWALGSGVAAVVLGVSAAVVPRKVIKEKKSAAETVADTSSVSRIGKYDLTTETIEFELRGLIEGLSKDGHPIVFVIDELDKIDFDINGADLQAHPIYKIVASLKNFFTLNEAIFTFIAGQDFYTLLATSVREDEYALAHTLFTDRLFLHVLGYRDLEQLIDLLLIDPPTASGDYRQFRNYLCWASRNHVFDLLSSIGDYLDYDDKGHPWIVVREAGTDATGSWREGNVPDDWRLCAGLQKFVGATYEESARPGARNERFNEAVWRSLLGVAHDLRENGRVEIATAGYELPVQSWHSVFEENDLEDLASACDRFLANTERHGTTSTEAISIPTKNEQGEEIGTEERVRYTLLPNPQYPPSSVADGGALTIVEQSFADLAERAERLAVNLEGNGIAIGDAQPRRDSIRVLLERVRGNRPRSAVPKGETQQGIRDAEQLGRDLIKLGLDGTTQRWADEHGATLTSDANAANPHTGEPWAVTLTEFPDLVPALADVSYCFLGREGSENQMVVLTDTRPEAKERVRESYKSALATDKGRDRRKQRLPVVDVHLAPDAEQVPLAREVVEVIESVPKTSMSFVDIIFGRTADLIRRQEEVDIAGWTLIVLEPELSNLDKLRTGLDDASYLDTTQEPEASA